VRRPRTWLLGIALALFALGVSAQALTEPAFTRIVASRTSLAAEAGLSPARILQVAEQVRRYVVSAGAPALPETFDGRPGFDAPAVSHLRDVRRVLRDARLATGLLAAVLVVVIGFDVARRRNDLIAEAMFSGAILSVAALALALVAATSNFDAFFSAFHGLFFKAGTWTFPSDSLLIETFPEAFWVTAGAAWATLVMLGAGCMALVGWLLRRGSKIRSAASG
jgi:integral membrane protein (TIGR01906 family)